MNQDWEKPIAVWKENAHFENTFVPKGHLQTDTDIDKKKCGGSFSMLAIREILNFDVTNFIETPITFSLCGCLTYFLKCMHDVSNIITLYM